LDTIPDFESILSQLINNILNNIFTEMYGHQSRLKRGGSLGGVAVSSSHAHNFFTGPWIRLPVRYRVADDITSLLVS
jgi:hypothetical protein